MEILKTKINKDNYTKYVCEKYDLKEDDFSIVEIPTFPISRLNEFDWNIGLIIGNSGSGKSSVLQQIKNNAKIAIERKIINGFSVISQFQNLSENEACELLCSIGLSSVPTWLRTPNNLSNGERARFDIAHKIANAKEGDIVLVDEFTSVVNRNVAKSMSFSLQKYARKKGIKIILASCHFDIIEWLTPNWIFNLNKQFKSHCRLEHIIYNNMYDINNIGDNEILSDEKYL